MIKKYMQDYKTINLKTNRFDIIGDIHGCYDELIELVHKLGYVKRGMAYFHPDDRRLVSVGDIADKGDKNIDSLNFWINQVNYGGGMWVYGNHCFKFYRYLIGNKVKLTHGIEKTVKEFNNLPSDEKELFKDRFIKCYEGRCHYIMLDNKKLIVVHGCLKEKDIGNFGKSIKTRCLYGDITGEFDENGKPIRNDWAKEYNGKSLIVYGHTAVKEAEIINNTIDIDTGCVYGGKLTAFRYPEREIVQVNGKAYAEYRGSKKIDFSSI